MVLEAPFVSPVLPRGYIFKKAVVERGGAVRGAEKHLLSLRLKDPEIRKITKPPSLERRWAFGTPPQSNTPEVR